MPKVSDAGRIILDERAKDALEKMLSELKGQEEHLRISPSKIGSRIIERYAEIYFERDKDLLIRQHFDSKEYLKRAISSLHSQEDIAKALEAALHKIRHGDKQSSRTREKHDKGATPTSESKSQAPKLQSETLTDD